ncbi:regulatory protein RecX [Microbacterium sp. C7(2022)]|uniref:regulatory protein RecX n=1 Tax=Microbacterium sp. C7(2022) TaxID=2992759 RepID=UPI00237A7798|nr:regulatory protein RecX [Microbacterium sp. C7(2022)]
MDSGAGATDEDALAPVIPMFGDARGELTAAAREAEPETEDDRVERGMAALLKRLRTRSLSIKESESVLRGLELEDADVAEVIERVLSYGYLDDAALAEQLVHTGTQRKGQGRGVIAQNLAKRGIPRDVADAALDTLPDDDAERALEFARTKARSLAGVERDAALRRLAGQLARRGYGGGVAFSAARTALDELAAPPSRVRFD